MVQGLVAVGMLEQAAAALKPMVDRVVAHGGFYEWWAKDGSPQGWFHFQHHPCC